QEMAETGAGEILLTSMDRDGTRKGYDVELTRAVAEAVSVPVIASGGVGTLEHLYEGLSAGAADAVLAASIFHFGEFTIAEAKRYLLERGVPVRPVVVLESFETAAAGGNKNGEPEWPDDEATHRMPTVAIERTEPEPPRERPAIVVA